MWMMDVHSITRKYRWEVSFGYVLADEHFLSTLCPGTVMKCSFAEKAAGLEESNRRGESEMCPCVFVSQLSNHY